MKRSSKLYCWKNLVPLLLQMGWTKEETDYLLDMLEQFDLRFVVVADRYNVSEGQAATGSACVT